jgi:peroxiredoxin
MRGRAGPWLVALGVAAAAAFALLAAPEVPPAVDRGAPAPDFALQRLGDGTQMTLAELRGRVVLVNFWATWVVRFQERLGLSFPILLDPDQKAARAYQTFAFPESLLIGPDGVVLERYVGAKEWDSRPYVERIRRLLRTRLPSSSA